MDISGLDEQIKPQYSIDATTLSCPDAFRAPPDYGAASAGSIAYSAEQYQKIDGARLFWGPYLALNAGVYLVTFSGSLKGQLSVDFACHSGKVQLKAAVLDSFSQPLCLVVLQSIPDFEVRGLKTRALKSLRLEAVVIRCMHLAASDRGQ